MEILFKEESYAIIGACFEVYKELGTGFLESMYQESLRIEFELRNIPNIPEPKLELSYKGRLLNQCYQPDFLCFGRVIIEIKAVNSTANEHRAQVHNYLKATKQRLGLLVNFGHHPKLEYERIVN